MEEVRTVYFDRPGPENTQVTLQLARERALGLGIRTILVATTKGEAGAVAAAYLRGFRVVVVTHAMGFRRANEQELTQENRKAIEDAGAIILTCPHPFAGLGRATRLKFGTFTSEEIIPNVLRLFGQGMKVAVEIAMMAADAGLARTDEEVVSIAGTDHGADTAVVLAPVNTPHFFNMRVREILCKPR
ncbi:MAG TPA: pyruvate kinase alpha/beta domain-containing protein [Dehalococcoidia bacterium]|nr:pyruvate kinase alpha/beta domain-containing protein [Dehalococcoidia bacterium]